MSVPGTLDVAVLAADLLERLGIPYVVVIQSDLLDALNKVVANSLG